MLKPFILLSILFSSVASGQMIPFAFWKATASDQLAYTTAAQSITAGLCSGITTVQSQDSTGAAKNVLSNLTINLTGPANATFYSDANCITPITSVVMTTGTNTRSFYFLSSLTGSPSVTASAADYASASQSQTITGTTYVWTGGGGNANWNTTANWSGAAVPGASNVAIFDSTCASNCSPTMNVAVSVRGLRLQSGYVGTVSHAANTLAIGASGFVQTAGTFTGSGAGSAITIAGGGLTINAGTFTSTTGTMTINTSGQSNPITIAAGASFAANSGTVAFQAACCGSNVVVTAPAATFNNLSFTGTVATYNLGGGTLFVAGNLTFGSTGTPQVLSGTIEVTGNLTSSGSAAIVGSAVVKLVGNASGQTITGNGVGILPIEVAAGTNAVTMTGEVSISGFAGITMWRMTSAGTFTVAGSTLHFLGASGQSYTIVPGTRTYNHVTFGSGQGNWDLGGATMLVGGSMTITGAGSGAKGIQNGNFEVSGDLVSSGTQGVRGPSIIKLTGNAAGQTISGNGQGLLPIEVDTGTNAVTMTGVVAISSFDGITMWRMTSAGTFTTTGSTLQFLGGDNDAYNVVPGTKTYNDVSFAGSTGTWDFGGSTMTVGGALNFASTGGTATTVNNGTFEVFGDLNSTAVSQGLGSGIIKLMGNAAGQTISGNGQFLPSIDIDAGVNPVTMTGTVLIRGNRYFYVTSAGTFTATGSTLNFSFPFLNESATFNPGGKTFGTIMTSTSGTANNTLNITGSLTAETMTLTNAHATNNMTVNMPDPGGAFALTVTGTLSLAARTILNLYGATKTEGTLSNSGTINP